MERWQGKVALVTGASAGIGEAIVIALVKNGMKVVGLARRVEKVEELKKKLVGSSGELFPLKGDVSKVEEIEATFTWIEKKFGTIHVLVNNAGISRAGLITDSKIEHLQDVINVNLIGPTVCSKKAIQLMQSTGVDDGHIININSVAGHSVINFPKPSFNVYPASKFGLTALTEATRQELRYLKTKIKVTSVSPGAVMTEIGQASSDATGQPQASSEEEMKFLQSLPFLESKDIAEGVVYVLSTPPHVQVHELTIKPVGEPF